jgi:hypothetical protein
MQEKKPGPKRRIPGDWLDRGRRQRTLFEVYQRALAVCASVDAERQIILAIAFAYVLEMPLPKFEAALRKYRRRMALNHAAARNAR